MKNILSIFLSVLLVLSLFTMSVGSVSSVNNSLDSVSEPNSINYSSQQETNSSEMNSIQTIDDDSTLDQDVSDFLDINLEPGKSMQFWLTDFGNEEGGVLMEANYNTEDQTQFAQFTISNFSSDTPFYVVYHNGDFVGVSKYDEDPKDPEVLSHLSGQTTLDSPELREKSNVFRKNDDKLVTPFYFAGNDDFSAAGIIRIVPGSLSACQDVTYSTNSDGKLVGISNMDAFQDCVDTDEGSMFEFSGDIEIIDENTVQIDQTIEQSIIDDVIVNQTIEDFDGRSQVFFNERINFTDVNDNVYTVNESAVAEFDSLDTIEDLDVINEVIVNQDGQDVNFSKNIVARTEEERDWDYYETETEDGTIVFNQEPFDDKLFEVNIFQGDEFVVKESDFEQNGDIWEANIPDEFDDETISEIKYYEGGIVNQHQNIDSTTENEIVDVDVEVIDFEQIFIFEDNGTEYISSPDNGDVINPISEIITINETTIERPFIESPNDFDQVLWEACDANFQRPLGDEEVNNFFIGDAIEVTMKPNEVIVSDRSGNEVENTSYLYPSQGSIEVETGEGLINIHNDKVHVPECAYVVDSGAGVNLPAVTDNTEFSKTLNTYYLDTEMNIRPFGLVGQYIDSIEDKEPVSGFNVNPSSGDVSVKIDSMNRANSDTFGETVTQFTLSEINNSPPTDITIHDLQSGREYSLYQDDELYQIQSSDEKGSVTFGISGDDWDNENEYTVFVDQRSQESSQTGSSLPSISLSSPAIILLVVTSSLLLTAGYIYWRKEGFGEEATIWQ